MSSLVLLLGVGSIVYYKWMTQKKKKRLPFGLSKAIHSENSKNETSFDTNIVSSGELKKKRYKMLSSTPFVDFCQSLELTPSVTSSDGSDLFFNFTDLSDENDPSFRTPLQKIGNNTVAKLDQLLEQIQDIKQSVNEIDEQIFDVKESNVKFESKMFSLGPDMSSSINTESDPNEKFDYFNTEPQTPTLEWDLTDFNAINGQNFSLVNENQLISQSLNSSYFRNQSLINVSKKSLSIESPEDLTSPSFSTSGEFSLSSPTDHSKEDNLAAIHQMITNAKRLGLLKDMINILVKNSKRDSAYFED